MRKTVLITLLIFILTGTTHTYASEHGIFSDISNNYWAKDSIEKLIELGIVNGFKDGTFKPEVNINVDAFIKLTITAIGFTNIENAEDYWATNYINKALELSIIEQEQFDTYDRIITREEMASITAKALGYMEDKDDIQHDFLFVNNCIRDFYNISDKYLQDVVESYYYGLVTGKSNGFDPKGNATRADAATVILRLLDKDSRIPIFIPPVVTENDIKKDENNKMYFDLVRYCNYKNNTHKANLEKFLCRIFECPNGEPTSVKLMYAMDKVYQKNNGYVFLEQLGEDTHPIGVKYSCVDKIENSYELVDLVDNSEVDFCIKHSKHDTNSSYDFNLNYKIHGMSYIDRYYKYNTMFDTIFLYLYKDKFPLVKEKFIEILTFAENMDVDEYSYIINLNNRQMYVEINKDNSVSFDFSIKGGKVKSIDEDKSSNENQPPQSAPNFSLKDMNGKVHDLTDYKGKKVYIKFWSSWCSHCVNGLDEINNLAKDDDDFEILTIVSPGYKGEKDEEDFIKWFSNLDYKNMNVLLDESGKIVKSYGITAYPTSIYINKDGFIVKRVLGHETNSNIIKEFSNME